MPGFQLNETLTGGAIGKVVASGHPDFEEGQHVESHFGWREAFVSAGQGLRKLGELNAPASAYLGVLGMPGMTAYVGLLDVGELKEGEHVFVSGAAGAVGSAVGQIAKIKNCTVVGSAGSAEKVRHLTDDLGFDHGFDYHEGHLERQIFAGAPQGIDVYFDNVGGNHLQAAFKLHATQREDSALWRYLPVQRHSTCPRSKQSCHSNRIPTYVKGIYCLQLQPSSRSIHARDDRLGLKWPPKVSRDNLRRNRTNAGCIHWFVYWCKYWKNDRKPAKLSYRCTSQLAPRHVGINEPI